MKKIEPLGGGIKVVTSDIHRFSTDTILLAYFASAKRNDRVIELGTGCGAISLIFCRDNNAKSITAVDIQTDACELLEESIRLNNLSEKITVINDDMRNLNRKEHFGMYDLAVCNPPYKEDGTGIKNPELGKKLARHEQNITLNEIVKAGADLLKFSGRLCMCQRIERLCDMMECMRLHSVEPKRLRLVQQRPDKPPKFFMLEGKRGGQRGGLVCEPTLIIEGEDGDFSEEMKKIYGIYKAYKYE